MAKKTKETDRLTKSVRVEPIETIDFNYMSIDYVITTLQKLLEKHKDKANLTIAHGSCHRWDDTEYHYLEYEREENDEEYKKRMEDIQTQVHYEKQQLARLKAKYES